MARVIIIKQRACRLTVWKAGRSAAGGTGPGPGSGPGGAGAGPSVGRPHCSAPLAVHTQGSGACVLHVLSFSREARNPHFMGNLLVGKSELKSRPVDMYESRTGSRVASCLTQTWEDQQGSSGEMGQGHKRTAAPKKHHQKQIWQEWQSRW